MEGRRRLATTPLGIVLVYVVVGTAWILFSDRVVDATVPEPARTTAQSVKGALYVAATAALLYVLIRRHLRERDALDAEVHTVLDAMTDAALVVDGRGRVVHANDAAVALSGAAGRRDLLVPMEDLLARIQLAHRDGRPVTYGESASARALRGETVTGYEARMRAPDGRERALSVSSAPLRTAAGGTGRLALTVLADRTEEKRFEQTREDFLATAAHELKTPLAVIKAHAQLMRRRGDGDADALAAIERQVERLTAMVQQLLDVSRFRVGGGELRRDRFDAGTLLAEAVDAARARNPGRNIQVRLADAAPVIADRDRIAQVMTTLLENAVRFSPRGGDVEAVATRRGGDARVTVRAHGTGVDPERQGRVFDRYYRPRAGYPDGGGAIGLGLGLCRDIVVRHGGAVGFDSEVGAGSTFWFTLPIVEEHPA